MSSHFSPFSRYAMLSIVLVLTVSGCRSPQLITDQLTKRIGVPFYFWGLEDDNCLKNQIKVYLSDYRQQGLGRRKAIRNSVKNNFRSVQFVSSKSIQEENSYRENKIQLISENGQIIREKVISTLVPAPQSEAENKNIGTKVSLSRDKDLIIQPIEFVIKKTSKVYQTKDAAAYRATESTKQLNGYLKLFPGMFLFSGEGKSQTVRKCGVPVSLTKTLAISI